MPYVYRPSILLSTIFTETSSNIVFEHPGITPAASKGEATPPGDARKLWGAEEGVPLVAMLQEKTLQTATYAVQKSATQSMFYHGVWFKVTGSKWTIHLVLLESLSCFCRCGRRD